MHIWAYGFYFVSIYTRIVCLKALGVKCSISLVATKEQTLQDNSAAIESLNKLFYNLPGLCGTVGQNIRLGKANVQKAFKYLK